MTTTIFGRTAELAMIRRVLEGLRDGPAAVMLQGDIGAGKTTLWDAAVSAARALGYRVLVAHPVESEQGLPYAALGDLLEGIVNDSDLRLPEPQRRALRVAMLLEDPEDGPPDQRGVSMATLTALRALSERSPVLVALDDVQWLDGPSARVLEFVARRLQGESIGIVAAVRATARAAVPALLDRSLSGTELHRLSLKPLDIDALDALFRTRLGGSLPRPMLAQVQRASGGNPLFALELARGIERGEIEPRAGEPLSVPSTLQQFVRERLGDLPTEVREVLFVAAAVSEPTAELLEATARRPEIGRAAIEAATSAGVVEVLGDHVRFVHPLFASTLYHAVPARHRRALHRKLAPLLADPDERARHLALGADGTDAAAAAAVDDAARRAAARGAPDAAAELAERAHELTPPDDAEHRERRRMAAAEYSFAAGDLNRARQILEEATRVLPPGPTRASVLRRLATVRYRNDSCSVAAQLLTRALAETGEDGVLRARIERDLAWAVMLCGDMGEAARHARSALQLVEGTRNDRMFAEILAATAMADFLQGRGVPLDTIRRAIGLEDTGSDTPIEWRPGMMLAMMLNWSGATSEARRRFDDLHHQALEAGEETSLPFLLTQMSESATWEGDWATGASRAEEAITIALQTGQEPMRAAALYARALAQAHRGELDAARASATFGLELAEQVGSVVMMMWNQTVLGFIELSVDEPAIAHGHLAPLVAWLDVVGIREPGMLRFVPDEVEALVALGELEKAEALLAPYEADATRLERRWAQLAASRCRALLSAASGNAVGAGDALAQALDAYSTAVPPFERARALLVLGSVQRRTRRRRAARDSLEAALEVFERLGAAAWSAKAERLLGRTRTPVPGEPSDHLTPSELRVARAVAAGATNREAADRLFVSTRTVELHLTSVYRKLGIRSRTELATKMANHDAAPGGTNGRDSGETPAVG